MSALSSFPYLSALVWGPLLGVLLLYLFPRDDSGRVSFWVALSSALVTFGFALGTLLEFKAGDGGLQLIEKVRWVDELGIWYALGIDGISLCLVLLTAVLTPVVIVASSHVSSNRREFLALLLLLETAVMGAVLALDLFLFYVFWEAMLIPAYFLIGFWGGENRVAATQKFLLYTVAGSVLMFVAILYVAWGFYDQSGFVSFLLSDVTRVRLTNSEQWWLFGAFVVAMGIKIPLFPLHTWLPNAYVAAPTAATVMLSAVLSKMGLYALVRFAYPLFPKGAMAWSEVLAILAVIGILYGALVAWVQTDMKRLIAYSSVSHLGFCMLGLVVLNGLATSGFVLQMVSHGLSTAALFLLLGALAERSGTTAISDYGGLAAKVPIFAVVFFVATLSSIALPFTSSFVGEFLILSGAFQHYTSLTIWATGGVVLGAVYMLSLYHHLMFGPLDSRPSVERVTDIGFRELITVVPLLLVVVALGVYPQPVLSRVEPVVTKFIGKVSKRGALLDEHDRRIERKRREQVVPEVVGVKVKPISHRVRQQQSL